MQYMSLILNVQRMVIKNHHSRAYVGRYGSPSARNNKCRKIAFRLRKVVFIYHHDTERNNTITIIGGRIWFYPRLYRSKLPVSFFTVFSYFNSHQMRLPHHTSFRKIAKYTEIMHVRHTIPNLVYYDDFLFNNDVERAKKKLISGSFLVNEILEILFPVVVHITKRRWIKFYGQSKGVYTGIFENQECFVPQKLTTLEKNRQLVWWLLMILWLSDIDLNEVCHHQCVNAALDCIQNCNSSDSQCISVCLRNEVECYEGKMQNITLER